MSKKTDMEAEDMETELPEEKTSPKTKEPEYTEAAVHSTDGQHVRSYSKEVHGENFHDLAKEFAKPRGFEVRAH